MTAPINLKRAITDHLNPAIQDLVARYLEARLLVESLEVELDWHLQVAETAGVDVTVTLPWERCANACSDCTGDCDE